MANKENKARQRAAVREWQAKNRAAARALIPLPNDQMKALFDMISNKLPKHGCDHSLRLTRAWLLEHKLDEEKVIAWLHNNSGFCDCEALANAEQEWLDALRE